VNRPPVIVVAKRSPFSRYIEEERDPHARKLLRRGDVSVANWMKAHREHLSTLEQVENWFQREKIAYKVLHGAYQRFDCSHAVLIVTVGGDGTLLRASHSIDNVPILGVNSAPKYSVGFFCAAYPDNVETLLERAMNGTLESVRLNRMSVSVNGSLISKRVLNEALYSHTSPAATSRYILQVGRVEEEQRSSGLWVGPAAGSTAAIRSAGGKELPLSSRKLQLVVREPYLQAGQRYRLQRVQVGPSERIVVVGKMVDASLFLDGPSKHLGLRLGDRVTFQASDEPLTLLGIRTRRMRRARRPRR
jgi:NAD+ kinase